MSPEGKPIRTRLLVCPEGYRWETYHCRSSVNTSRDGSFDVRVAESRRYEILPQALILCDPREMSREEVANLVNIYTKSFAMEGRDVDIGTWVLPDVDCGVGG